MSELEDPEIFRTILDSLKSGVYVVDRNGKILFWNTGAERITGRMRHDVIGRSCTDSVLPHCNQKGCVACSGKCPTAQTIQEGKPKEARMLLRHREGHPVPVQMRLAPLRNRQGPIIAVAKSFDEHKAGSERNRSRYHLVPQGCFDEITGVSNHEFTQFRLRESLASFAQYQSPFGILLIQVDQLQHFGATYGRPAVDAILHVLAQTLQDSLRPSDFVGHWQDGQFLAIVIGCGAVGVERARERIAGAVSTVSMLWWGDEMSVTNSVGCAPVQSGDTIDSLLQRAEHSLSQACAPSSGPASTGPPTQHTRRES